MSNPTAVPTVFHFHEAPVRTVTDAQGNPKWVVKDVCDILGVVNSRDALARVPENHKGVDPIDTPGGVQMMNVVDEPGLYRLILRSDKPQAEPFMEWVTAEVLPAIRKTGGYGHSVPPDSMVIAREEHIGNLLQINQLQRQNILMLQEKLEAAQNKIKPRKNFTPEEDALVLELRAQGLSYREIGLRVGRQPQSVKSCLRRLGEAQS